ncbi:MAG: muramoyltetrapeptide carboxypeptidase [Acidobacteriota bacterium]|nr:muramoyltetrapeptide carboxypeptidase [Acidobacteriota bacterium]
MTRERDTKFLGRETGANFEKGIKRMNRRNFLRATGATTLTLPLAPRLSSAAQTNTGKLIKPKALRAGDVVGVIAPGTAVPDPDRLALVEPTLKFFGLRARLGKYVATGSGHVTRTVSERLDDLHAMFRDPGVSAVFCIRGGYGSMQLLDRIDYDLIRRNPKVFLGYSDITALHLAINRHAGLVTFHGPIVLSSFTDYTQQNFRRALFDARPAGKLTNPAESNALRPEHPLRTIHSGTATGQLVGGNLSLVTALMGTPYEIETRGRILFLEDVGEEPYRIDRMLTQLRLAGKLDQAAGIVFGECSECAPADYKPSFAWDATLGEVLDNILGSARVPVFTGLTIGHTADQLTLPLGVNATLNADEKTLELKEAGVV